MDRQQQKPAAMMVGGKAGRDLKGLSFPHKLHIILQDAEERNLTIIVSWNPDGTGFRIHNRYYFEAHIIPNYFTSAHYRSFQHSLNVWGFNTVSKGAHASTIWHPCFRRGRDDLCKLIERIPIKKNAEKEQKSDSNKFANIKFDQVQGIKLPPRKISATMSLSPTTAINPSSQQQTPSLANQAKGSVAGPQHAMLPTHFRPELLVQQGPQSMNRILGLIPMSSNQQNISGGDMNAFQQQQQQQQQQLQQIQKLQQHLLQQQ
jgi:hypothetical protein